MKALPAPNVRVLERVLKKDQDGKSGGERGVEALENWTRSSQPKTIKVTPRGLQERVGECPMEL